MSRITPDLVGRKFGKLTIISQVGVDIRYQRLIKCKCDCGNTIISTLGKLKSGHTKSCGCFRRQLLSQIRSTHGDSRPHHEASEYRAWARMKARCYNLKDQSYKYYGGRGITVCDRWIHSYENFLADMGRKPSTNHSIDRINNDGNYDAINCHWATKSEQMKNRRTKHKNGEGKTS